MRMVIFAGRIDKNLSTLSVCIIAKNEENCIENCLKDISAFSDEIIIVDTGSTDNTKDIAAKYTDKIFDFKWNDDFSDARNFSFDRATKDYIMWIDCDDRITKENQIRIKNLKENLTQDVVMMQYHVNFDKDDNVTLSYYRERILKNNKKYKWTGRVHEVITPFGEVIYSDIFIEHRKNNLNKNPKRNIQIYEKMIEDKVIFTPRDIYYYGRELFYNLKYQDCIDTLLTFLKNADGWYIDKIEACKIIYNCYKELDDIDTGIKYLFNSFLYGNPRNDICCEIGDFFLNKNDYRNAIFWFELSISQEYKEGFIDIDKCGFYPFLQLCVCYYKIGDIINSELYNERAGKIKPNDISYLYNKEFFQKLKNSTL